jgi:hypothetical protein
VNSKPGIDATKKLPGEGFKRPCPRCETGAVGGRRTTLVKMDAAVKAKVKNFVGNRE